MAAGYGFYCASGLKNLLYILSTTVTTFFAGLYIGKGQKVSEEDDETEGNNTNCRLILAVTLIFNFGLLIFSKYFSPFGMQIESDFNSMFNFSYLGFLVPLGILFYTLQSSSYIIDIYRKKITPEKNIFKYALFVSYFPQLMMGPISKYSELETQFFEPEGFDWADLKYGIQLMMWGYFKRMIIADRLAIFTGYLLQTYSENGGLVIFFTIFIYGLQLYCNFSGGVDIAIGSSKTLGINLSEGFKRPFFAVTVSDFFTRWNISLQRWMKDYLFHPISIWNGFRKNALLSRCVATIIMFLAVGLWYGFEWQFAAYGLFYGILISLGMITEKTFVEIGEKVKINPNNLILRILGVLRTIFLVTISSYFLWSDSIAHALDMLRKTFINPLPALFFARDTGLKTSDLIILSASVIILTAVSVVQEKGYSIREILEEKNRFVQGLSVFAMLFILTFFGIYS